MKLIDKDALVAEIERRVTEGEKVAKELPSSAIMGLIQAYKNTLSFIETLEVIEIGIDLGDPKGDKSAKYIIDTNSLEVKEVDLEDAKKEELAQKYVDYTFKRHNIDANSKEGQLIYYAYIHGMNQCLDKLKAQKGE